MICRIIVLVTLLLVTTSGFAVAKNKSAARGTRSFTNLVRDLGWVRDCAQNNLCCGYYFEPNDIVTNPSPKPLKDMPMSVTATEPALFTQKGASVLRGNVVLLQPGREITADRVTFFRDDGTGKINRSLLYGHVNFREYGKLIVAEQGNLDFVNKAYSFNNGVYRLLADTPTGLTNVWGQAKRAVSDESEVLKLTRATYTSCPPDAISWHLWGSRTNLDRNIGRGEVTNGILFFKKVPVFYFPYYHFPIDKRRISGFLTPTLNYSSKNVYRTSLPYYFNLAPNYDALLVPEYYSQRGVLFQGLFRYLTPNSSGGANLDYIHHDRQFIKFRDSASVNSSQYIRALQSLKDSGVNRGLINFQHNSSFSEHWAGKLDVNYAADDYFVENFPDALPTYMVGSDQLLNQAHISYSDYNWNLFGQLQMFQTLHRITYPGAQDQYKRLPHIGVSGNFPDGWAGLDYGLDSEIVNFAHRDDFYQPESTLIVRGTRFNIMPSISAPLDLLGGYVIPRVQLQTVGYSLHDRPKRDDPNNIMHFYPLVSVDSGIVLSRNLNIFREQYAQTLEPRIFYLFVPYVNQDTIPIFDTYSTSFNFDQLFRTNRFSGFDRVGDANQMALAVTTRFLNNYGQERFNVGVGQIFSWHKHQIDISKSSYDPLRNYNLSPLVGRMQFYIDSSINSSLDCVWDPHRHHFSSAGVNLGYSGGAGRFLNLGYNYTVDGDNFKGSTVDLKRVNVSMGWRIWRHWNIFGNLYYNVSSKRAESHLYGLEYDGCCWALCVVRNRNFIGLGADANTRYDSTYTLQLVLKGVGSYLNTFTSKKGVGKYIDDFLNFGDEKDEK
ncbi:MAG: LPS assembly protein LptD [Coxiellaceae bacterium]|nr:LPS assembly protein LptD [Coxiellaceae bacterium]